MKNETQRRIHRRNPFFTCEVNHFRSLRSSSSRSRSADLPILTGGRQSADSAGSARLFQDALQAKSQRNTFSYINFSSYLMSSSSFEGYNLIKGRYRMVSIQWRPSVEDSRLEGKKVSSQTANGFAVRLQWRLLIEKSIHLAN